MLGTVKKEGEANERATNTVFNCLAVDDNNPDPYRFFYDSASGSGYMDLLVDGTNTTGFGTHDRTENMSGTYTLTSVSYTHLDVYKRQLLPFLHNYPRELCLRC